MNLDLNFLFNYLKKEKIYIDQTEFEFQIQSHPDYPSLLSIADTLSFFKIKNLATKINNEDIANLPSNFIALIKDTNLSSNLTLVEKNNKGYKYSHNDHVVEINEETFLNRFQNIVLLVDKDEERKELNEPKKSKKVLILYSALVGLCYLTLTFINGFSISLGLFVLLSSIGVYLSYEAISSEFGIKTKFSEAICTITISADCNAVINSVKSKTIKKIGISNISFAFFFTQLLGLFLFSIFQKSGEFFNIISILLLLSIPVIALSIYYQTLIEKKWCPICMAIILVIFLELSILISTDNFQAILRPVYFISYIFLLIGVYSLIYLIKNSYKFNIVLKSEIAQNNRFKRNYSLFKMSLQASEKLKIKTFDFENIILGNPNSNLKIIVVSSPFCSHCKKAHELITKILDRYNDKVSIQFHFNLDMASSEQNTKDLHFKLVEIYLKYGQNQFLKNVDTWFKTTDYNKIEGISELSQNQAKSTEILQKQYNWNRENELNFTPAIIVNGFHFPKEYNRSDLIFFIDELEDDESLNL
jgi:glutaredoxin